MSSVRCDDRLVPALERLTLKSLLLLTHLRVCVIFRPAVRLLSESDGQNNARSPKFQLSLARIPSCLSSQHVSRFGCDSHGVSCLFEQHLMKRLTYMCGDRLQTHRHKHIQFRLVHGSEDVTVPHLATEKFARQLHAAGLDVHVSVIVNAAHMCTTLALMDTYDHEWSGLVQGLIHR